MMKLVDLHQDLLFHLGGGGGMAPGSQTSFEALERNDTRLVAASVFISPAEGSAAVARIGQELAQYAAMAAGESSLWTVVRRSADVDAVLHGVQRGLLLHIEGLNAWPDDGVLTLERWFAVGLRSLGIVWNMTNALGGGCDDALTGLSKLGEHVLRWCERRGIVVDLAHMNDRTFWDALDVTAGPVIVSHVNMRGLRQHRRNLPDDGLRAVALRDGVVGIGFVGEFVASGRRAVVSDVADHVEYACDRVGVRHVAIGSDFGGIVGDTVVGLESLDCLCRLWDELSRRGWRERDLQRISWANAARVLKLVLPK